MMSLESTIAVLAIAILAVLALYLALVRATAKAALAAILAAALVSGLWYVGAERKEEIRALQERLAAYELRPEERGFTAEGRELLVRRLADYAGPTALVVANASDPETVEYARRIVDVLIDAGWKVPPSFGMTSQPIVLPGEDAARPGVVLGTSPDVPREFSASVARVFRDGGIDVVEGPHWPGTEHPVSILVGPKRQP